MAALLVLLNQTLNSSTLCFYPTLAPLAIPKRRPCVLDIRRPYGRSIAPSNNALQYKHTLLLEDSPLPYNLFSGHAITQALLSGHMEALWSQYRPLTRPDHTLLARLLQPNPGDIKSKVCMWCSFCWPFFAFLCYA